MLYKRGNVWWYDFEFKGARYRNITKLGNKRVAESIEAAKKPQLAKGEVGIEDRKPAPTLKEFAPRFEKAIETQCSDKPRTVEFYRAKLKNLLSSERLFSRRIDAIDEPEVEEDVEREGQVAAQVAPFGRFGQS